MDSKKVGSMKEKLLTIASYYSDIREYAHILGDLDEKFDETLEYYNFDEWLHGAGGKRTGMAAMLLGKTESIFFDLYQESEKELYAVYKEICSMDEEEQMQIWNRKRTLWDEEKFRDYISEAIEYRYNQSDATEEFIRCLDEMEKELTQ